jgi:hypothetical protein
MSEVKGRLGVRPEIWPTIRRERPCRLPDMAAAEGQARASLVAAVAVVIVVVVRPVAGIAPVAAAEAAPEAATAAKATVAGCEATATTHVGATELPARESAATTKSAATEVTAAAKAAGMASTKATAMASAATTTTTTMTTPAASASTSPGEGVGLDRGHARGDDCENDCYFAQHQTLLLRTQLHPWMFSDTPRQPARSGRVAMNVGIGALACLRAIATAVRVLRQSILGARSCNREPRAANAGWANPVAPRFNDGAKNRRPRTPAIRIRRAGRMEQELGIPRIAADTIR